jgi:NAD(P)-dependent dehydrogenase (short-subunit alcohol dehydrogenase family)
MKLENRVVLITGASRGLGRVLSTDLAREGARLVLCARGVAGLSLTAELARKAGAEVVERTADVSLAEDVRALVEAGLAWFGRLDVLVNNAAVFTGKGGIDGTTVEQFDGTMAVNVRGSFLVTQAVRRAGRRGDIHHRSFLVTQAVLQGIESRRYGPVRGLVRLQASARQTRVGGINGEFRGPTASAWPGGRGLERFVGRAGCRQRRAANRQRHHEDRRTEPEGTHHGDESTRAVGAQQRASFRRIGAAIATAGLPRPSSRPPLNRPRPSHSPLLEERRGPVVLCSGWSDARAMG